MEDKDTCTTELFLRADGVIEFGDTDGPKPVAVKGHWYLPNETNEYYMTIQRTFSAGKSGTDVGDFHFDRA
jgi:hypothetical protein